MIRLRRGRIVVILMVLALMLTGCSGKKSASDYYKDGMDSYKDGKYEEAAVSLSKAVTKNPNKAEYYIDYGMVLTKLGNYEEAFIQFDKAILNKDNKIVRQNNKMAYRGKGIAYFESADYKAACEQFELALEIPERDDLDIDILYYLGDAQTKTLDIENAVKTYGEIIDEYPSESDAYWKRAVLEGELERYDEAIHDFDKAINYDKNNYDYYFGKYFIMIKQGDENAANEVLTKALAIKTKTDEDYYNLARLYFYQGDYEKATTELTSSAEKGFSGAYFYLGEIAMKNSEYENAVKYYEQYIGKEPDVKSAVVYNQLGDANIKLKDYEKAFSYIEKGIELNDSTMMQALQYNEVVALEYLSKFEEAYKKAKEYLKIYKDDENMKKELEFLKTRQENVLIDNTDKN
ncbi:MAG TPA: tetratricopeptide repeat protein [Lachnospiraceae bacterium]|nr:tetratricopeptide repeat protein [Lachnospiraceae bacterium]